MRSFWTGLMGIVIILLVVVGLTAALLPTIISTDWGRKNVVNWINHSIPGKIEIRSLSINWRKGQTFEGVLLKDPEGQSVLGLERFSTEATLWQLFQRTTHLGFTQIQDLNAAIVTDEEGWTNLQRALGIAPSDSTPPLLSSIIVLSDVNADINLFADHQPLSGSIKGHTRQENLMGSFELNIALNGLQGSDWKKLKKDAENYLSIEGSKEATIQARVINFPVDLIDRLTSLKNPDLNGLFRSLLGDRLNLSIDKESSNEGLAFNLTAQTPLMQGDVKGQVVKGAFNLQESAVFHFNLTPESVNPFTHDLFELTENSHLKVILQNLSFPLNFLDPKSINDPCQFAFKAHAIQPETSLVISPIGRLNLVNMQILLNSSACDQIIHMEIIGQGQQEKESFDIQFVSTSNKPSNFSQLFQQIHKNTLSTLKISHLPLRLIPYLQHHSELIEELGSYADLQLRVKPVVNEYREVSIVMQTPHFNLSKARFRLGKDLALTAPVKLDWKITPNYFQKFFQDEYVAKPCPIQMLIKRFQISLNNPAKPFHLEFAIPELQLSQSLSVGSLQLKNLQLKIDGQSLSEFSSQLKAQLALFTSDGHASPILDRSVELLQEASWKIGPQGAIEIPFTQLQLNSSTLSTRFEGRMNSEQNFTLTKPAHIHYAITPEAFQFLKGLEFLNPIENLELPQLKKAANLDLIIDPTTFLLDSSLLSLIHAKGVLTIDHIELQKGSTPLPVLEGLTFPWSADGPLNTLSINLQGMAYAKAHIKPSQLSGIIHIEHWLDHGKLKLSKAKAEIQADFMGLPISPLSVLLTNHDLEIIFGQMMDIEFKTLIDKTHESAGYLDLIIDSSEFHARTRLKEDNGIRLFDPAKTSELRWTISPKSYAYLKTLLNFQDERILAAPFTVSGLVTQFYLPSNPSKGNLGNLAAHFKTTDLLWEQFPALPVKLKGQINSDDLNDSLYFSAEALSPSTSFLKIHGSMDHLFNQDWKLNNWQKFGLNAKAQGQQLSSSFISALFLLTSNMKQKIETLFGDSFDAEANCQLRGLNGPIQAKIEGSQGVMQIDGQLTEGLITLNSPLEGKVHFSPLFAQTFLGQDIPFLGSAIAAEEPVKLIIDPKGFTFPLYPFNLDQATIGQGKLDLGKITFRNEGELSSILNLIRPISSQQVKIWFTPIYFQLQQEQLIIKRLDMFVANAYTLASWGKINLKAHEADLVLGLSAQTLNDVFNINGLDDDYLLQIPLYSRQGKVEIDKKKATAHIGALIAQTKGGSKGKILGGMIDMAFSNKDEIKAPPPLTQPFPWAREISAPSTSKQVSSENPGEPFGEPSGSEHQSKKKKNKHKKDLLQNDFLNDLQNEATHVLDRFLSN